MSEELLREKIQRLRDLLAKANEPHPAPFETTDSRWDAIDVQNENASRHNRWARRVREAREAAIDMLPALIDHLEADGGVEAMREALEKIERLDCFPVSNPHAGAQNGKEIIRAKSIARQALSALPVLGVGR